MDQRWEYLTAFISGALDFPEEVSRTESLLWASVSITQQLNEHAASGWELMDIRWLSDREAMTTFRRPAQNSTGNAPDEAEAAPGNMD